MIESVEKNYHVISNEFDSYKMIKNGNLDAIAMATLDFWHMKLAVDALKAGIHVYC